MWRYALPVVVLGFFALGFLLAPNDPTQTHAMDKFLQDWNDRRAARC